MINLNEIPEIYNILFGNVEMQEVGKSIIIECSYKDFRTNISGRIVIGKELYKVISADIMYKIYDEYEQEYPMMSSYKSARKDKNLIDQVLYEFRVINKLYGYEG